jgi:hypothetical protein
MIANQTWRPALEAVIMDASNPLAGAVAKIQRKGVKISPGLLGSPAETDFALVLEAAAARAPAQVGEPLEVRLLQASGFSTEMRYFCVRVSARKRLSSAALPPNHVEYVSELHIFGCRVAAVIENERMYTRCWFGSGVGTSPPVCCHDKTPRQPERCCRQIRVAA